MFMTQVRLFVLALQFYSRAPIDGRLTHWAGYSPERLAQATRFVPLVGLWSGLLIALTYVALAQLLPHSVAVMLSLIVGILATGAFNESGWAGFCDSLANRSRIEPGQAPSPLGAFGALGLLLLMLLKLETLASLDPSWIGMAVITANPFSRGCAVLILISLNHAQGSDAAPARPVVEQVGKRDAAIALLLGLIPALAAAWWLDHPEAFLAALVPAMAVTAWIRRAMRKRLNGYTGDGLCATQQLAETAYYLGLLAWWTLSNAIADATPE